MGYTDFLSNPQFVDWLSQLIIGGGIALLVAGVISLGSGHLLGLEPSTKLWAFIVGFAFLCSLASAPVSGSETWKMAIALCVAPLVGVLIYFLPTALAIASGNHAFQAIFVLNLLFGWTILGWFVALGWALRRTQVPTNPGYRITAFGAVPEPGPSEEGQKSA